MGVDIFIVDRGSRVLLVAVNNVALTWLSENTRTFARPAPRLDITKIRDVDKPEEPASAQWWGRPENGIHHVEGNGWSASANPFLDVELRYVADIVRSAIEDGLEVG
jgi:hypothetical protein